MNEIGVWFIGIACNTLHTFLPLLAKKDSIVSIVDGVEAYLKDAGYQRVIVLGTETTRTQNLYGSCASDVSYPTPYEQDVINRIINRILAGQYWERDRDYLERLVKRYHKSKGIEAVVLGCTELSVLHQRTKFRRSFRQIDPLKLLASSLIAKGTST